MPNQPSYPIELTSNTQPNRSQDHLNLSPSSPLRSGQNCSFSSSDLPLPHRPSILSIGTLSYCPESPSLPGHVNEKYIISKLDKLSEDMHLVISELLKIAMTTSCFENRLMTGCPHMTHGAILPAYKTYSQTKASGYPSSSPSLKQSWNGRTRPVPNSSPRPK